MSDMRNMANVRYSHYGQKTLAWPTVFDFLIKVARNAFQLFSTILNDRMHLGDTFLPFYQLLAETRLKPGDSSPLLLAVKRRALTLRGV